MLGMRNTGAVGLSFEAWNHGPSQLKLRLNGEHMISTWDTLLFRLSLSWFLSIVSSTANASGAQRSLELIWSEEACCFVFARRLHDFSNVDGFACQFLPLISFLFHPRKCSPEPPLSMPHSGGFLWYVRIFASYVWSLDNVMWSLALASLALVLNCLPDFRPGPRHWQFS